MADFVLITLDTTPPQVSWGPIPDLTPGPWSVSAILDEGELESAEIQVGEQSYLASYDNGVLSWIVPEGFDETTSYVVEVSVVDDVGNRAVYRMAGGPPLAPEIRAGGGMQGVFFPVTRPERPAEDSFEATLNFVRTDEASFAANRAIVRTEATTFEGTFRLVRTERVEFAGSIVESRAVPISREDEELLLLL